MAQCLCEEVVARSFSDNELRDETMRVPIVLSILFLASMVAVVAGYYNFDNDLSLFFFFVPKILHEIPVIRAAFAMTLLCPIGILFCFWESRGRKQVFLNELIAVQAFTPFVVIFTLLPSEQAKPVWASLNINTMWMLFWLSNSVATRALHDWFWERGHTKVTEEPTDLR